MLPIHDFFRDLDRAWKPAGAARMRLPIIGAGALLLQTNYERLTKDSDVLETTEIDDDVRRQFEALAGRNSRLQLRHRLYLDVVRLGLPLLPQRPRWIPLPDLTASLAHFRIEVLDVVDVVVSKLKRFHANDRADIAAMVDRELVPHDRLVDRFRSAADLFWGDARAAELPRYVANLHQVERDFLGGEETEIELPPNFDV